MRGLIVIAVVGSLIACGDDVTVQPDAGPPDAPMVDATSSFVACGEFAAPGQVVPLHTTGTLAGGDLVSPSTCASVDAPFGIEAAGPDSVHLLEGLVVGTTYIVRLSAATDLGFYVVTGCSTAAGPSASECLLFVDATSRGELGQFVATTSSAYVVVDYYAATPPSDLSYALDVYAQECSDGMQCSIAQPVCYQSACVECASSFDCHAAERSRCDPTSYTCERGLDTCSSDDAGEPANDGPAGAAALVVDAGGQATHAASICSSASPAGSEEADHLAFEVTTVGETWDFDLAWNGGRDLDLEVFDATGASLALSYWEHPGRARLTYLVPGTYYVRITEFASPANPTGLGYTLSATRGNGLGCVTEADCATTYRNQIYRGSCVAGSCVDIEGDGQVAEGGACDSLSDCTTDLRCPSFFFVADADTRATCARECSNDGGCSALGTGYVCTTYLPDNFCVQKCTSSEQCPTSINTPPSSGPWVRLMCDLPTGRCLP